METSLQCAPACELAKADEDAGADGRDGASDLSGILTYGPLLGSVTERAVKIWAQSERAGKFVVRAWPLEDEDAEQCTQAVDFDDECDFSGVALLNDLNPDTTYAYQLELVENSTGCSKAISRSASFRTLPEEGEPTRVRFAVGADVRGADVPGFADIGAVNPNFVLMIGDNVYAGDRGYVEGHYQASYELAQGLYQEVWGGDQFRDLFSHVPVFMMWDDHEIMENYWRGKDNLRYAVGRALFDIYQGSHNPDSITDGELYYSFQAGDVGFFVLDTRTHRDSNEDKDDANKSMLGQVQLQAFEDWLSSDQSRVHVIVSSVIVSDFKTTGKDPWSSFGFEREAWLDVIASAGTRNTIIVSGDQHWSAVLRLTHGEADPYIVYEFQTTPLGSGPRMVPAQPNEAVLALDNTHQVFGLFDVDTGVDPPELHFTLCAVGQRCAPPNEPLPVTTAEGTTIPYSLHFVGGPRGFSLVDEL